jgi:hypothetical protein
MKSMNIFTLSGKKVIVTEETATWGDSYDVNKVSKYLIINKEYTIERTEVGGFHTDVYLVEVPQIRFNSVNFISVDDQSEDENKNHPDWKKFNE